MKTLTVIFEFVVMILKKIGLPWFAEFFKRIMLKSPKWFNTLKITSFIGLLIFALPLVVGKIYPLTFLLITFSGNTIAEWCWQLVTILMAIFIFSWTPVQNDITHKLEEFIKPEAK
jgi:hypothetical protein